MKRARLGLLGLALLAAASCGYEDPVSGSAAVSVVSVRPDSVDVQMGDTVRFGATVVDVQGTVVADRTVSWSVQDGAVASIDAAGGLATGIFPGRTTVVAEVEGVRGTATLVVPGFGVDSVLVSPDSAEIRVGGSRTFTAETFATDGTPLPQATVAWSVGNAAVATVDPASGVVTGVGPGVTTVRATSEGAFDQAVIAVSPVPVDSVLITPDSAEVREGGTVPFMVEVFDSTGAPLAGRAVSWSTGDPAVATVDAAGVVTGVSAGVTAVVASSEGVLDSARVAVSPLPVDSVAVTPGTAAVLDSAGNALTGRALSWSSSDPGVATVDAATGVATGVAPGTASIVATSEGVSGSAILNVTVAPVDSVRVSPDAADVSIGLTTAFTAAVFDSTGIPLTGRTVTWSSGDPGIATVDPSTGVATGVAEGTVAIIATSEGVTDSALLTVFDIPVDSVRVTPDSAGVRIGYTRTFSATTLDASGNVLTGRLVTWTTGNPGIASVDPATGVVTGVAAGTTTVIATSEGVSDTAVITVSPAPVTSVTVSPASAEVRVGGKVTYAAALADSTGRALTGRSVAWSVLDGTVASVNTATGEVTGLKMGSTSVVALSEGVADTAAVTVSAVPVSSVAVTPDPAEVRVGGTRQLTATVTDSLGNTVGRTVSWTSADPGTASVDASGLVVGVALGTTTVVAAVEGKADTVTVNVTGVPVGSVTISPDPAEVRAGGVRQLSVALTDSLGAPVTRPVTWTTGNAAVATVDQSGLLTGVAVGATSVIASSEGKADTVAVSVTAAPVASVTLTPDPLEVRVGGTRAVAATVVDSLGATVTRTLAWSSGNAGIATVDGAGAVTGVAVGTTTVVGSVEGRADTVTVNVSTVPVGTVTVTPDPAEVRRGGTAQLAVALTDSLGAPVTRPVTWTSADTTVVKVSGTGLLTGIQVGSSTVVATSEGKADTVTVDVTASPVVSVTIAPDPAVLPEAGSLQLTATVVDSVGATVTDRVVAWASANDAVVTVDAAGLLRGTTAGSTSVTASVEGKADTVAVTVTPVAVGSVVVAPDSAVVGIGAAAPFTATVLDAGGNPLFGRTVTWATGDAGIATVDPATGVVTGVAAGTTTVEATSEGVTGTASVRVSSTAVGSVVVEPASSQIRLGETLALTATVLDGGGNPLTGRYVAWSSGDASVATVDPGTGLVTGVGEGTASIFATSEGVLGIASVTVFIAAVDSVQVSPDSTEVRVGGSTTFQATLRDDTGVILTGRTVAWSSSDPGVATIDPASGQASGVAPGTTVITATSEGVSDTAILTVSQVPVDSVLVSPDSALVQVGGNATFTAAVFDSTGATLTGRAVTWSTGDAGIATVDPGTGEVTGVAPGTTSVTATSEGVSDSAILVVAVIPVDSVSVSPDSAGVRVGYTTTFTASLFDAGGNPITDRTATWSTGDAGIATVDPATGVVTGVTVGSTVVVATAEGVADTAKVTVSLPLAVSLTISPDSIDLRPGGSTTFTAAAVDSAGAPVPGLAVAWTSSNPGVAAIGPASGVATASAVGVTTITATVDGLSDTAILTVSRQRIAFFGRTPSRIWAVDAADGANEAALTGGGATEQNPAWSPDGNAIAYTALVGGDPELFIMGADGANPVQLTNNNFFEGWPSFSPDGSLLVYTSQRGNQDRDVYIFDRAAGTGARLVADAGSSEVPSFSPDGTKVVFQSNRDGGDWEIYVMNADGTNQVRLTTSAGFDGQARFSPDGTRIVFTSERDGNREIYSMAADGTDVVRLTSLAGVDQWPSWSPDGASIVFSSDRGGALHVWVMDANGANPAQRTTGAGGDDGPVIQPLGR